ncbi:DNA primase, catalytic core [Synechococcus sp. PCC 7502]|uniref:DNA primase n=1 Tax=Synechococcus sp. PCC 7502 TaxID=1173263 RepID=UPI00029FE15F|nr:DNA primase [Synechococcus sp. PCC 7502]AFY74350.1 DNA primase, catalytic core [Synechococcus sp. PCC 7502]
MSNPKLHQETIDQVSQRVDLVEVVSEHVVLRKSGANYRGACPFHKGTNQSALTVTPSKQVYHCFSCGASGNVFKFLMEIGDRSFNDVVIDLAQKYSIPVRTLEPAKSQELQQQLSIQEQLFEVVGLAASFFQHALFSPQGQNALEYLTHKRQLSIETIQTFQLGYAPAGWDTLYSYLVKQKRIPVSLVEQAGLIMPRKTGDGYYDRFRDRLMIPIHDTRSRAIAFGGRCLDNSEPKYLNSPETPLFSKSSILFAMDKARDAISKNDQAIVVEGYFDAIALHQAGINQVVASMGVALGQTQIRQLLRYTDSKKIILNFDGDKAGINAAERAIAGFKDLVYGGAVQLRILTIPSGKDADEFLKDKSPQAYQRLLQTIDRSEGGFLKLEDSIYSDPATVKELVHAAPLFLDWQIEQTLIGKDLNQADQFQECTQAFVKILNEIPDGSLRTHYIHGCAQRLAQHNSYLIPRLEQDLRRQLRQQRWYSHKHRANTPTSTLQIAETQLLQIYLHFPQHRSLITEMLEETDICFSLSHHRQLWQIIMDYPLSQTAENLITYLQIACAELPELSSQLSHVLWLDQNAQVALLRPTVVIKAAIARIQLIMTEKKYRYWRDLWEKIDLKTNPDLGYYYQTKIQAEQAQIQTLQKQVEITFTDLAEITDDDQERSYQLEASGLDF